MKLVQKTVSAPTEVSQDNSIQLISQLKRIKRVKNIEVLSDKSKHLLFSKLSGKHSLLPSTEGGNKLIVNFRKGISEGDSKPVSYKRFSKMSQMRRALSPQPGCNTFVIFRTDDKRLPVLSPKNKLEMSGTEQPKKMFAISRHMSPTHRVLSATRRVTSPTTHRANIISMMKNYAQKKAPRLKSKFLERNKIRSVTIINDHYSIVTGI